MAFLFDKNIYFLFSKHLDTMANVTDCNYGKTIFWYKVFFFVLVKNNLLWLRQFLSFGIVVKRNPSKKENVLKDLCDKHFHKTAVYASQHHSKGYHIDSTTWWKNSIRPDWHWPKLVCFLPT